jgi:outer membrane protein
VRKLFSLITLCFFSLGGCDQPPPKSYKNKQENNKLSSHLKRNDKSISPSSSPNSAHIGVLDFNKVWQEAKAPERIRSDIQEKRRNYQKEVIKFEEQLRREEESLQSQHEKISAEEYQKKKKKFEEAVLDLQKKVQYRKQGLEKAYSSAMNEVADTLNKIVEKIAQEQKLDLILSATQIAYNNKELNITTQVIDELDMMLSHVELKE